MKRLLLLSMCLPMLLTAWEDEFESDGSHVVDIDVDNLRDMSADDVIGWFKDRDNQQQMVMKLKELAEQASTTSKEQLAELIEGLQVAFDKYSIADKKYVVQERVRHALDNYVRPFLKSCQEYSEDMRVEQIGDLLSKFRGDEDEKTSSRAWWQFWKEKD